MFKYIVIKAEASTPEGMLENLNKEMALRTKEGYDQSGMVQIVPDLARGRWYAFQNMAIRKNTGLKSVG